MVARRRPARRVSAPASREPGRADCLTAFRMSAGRRAGARRPRPRGRGIPGTRAGAYVRPVRAGDRGTVLVIDDEVDVAESAVALFQSDGYAAVAANNGQAAFELLRTGAIRPCVIVLDLMMPVMDGWAFRAAQLCDATLASIPVIVVSAAGPSNVAAAAEAMRAVAGIAKPVDGDELLRVVGAHCRLTLH